MPYAEPNDRADPYRKGDHDEPMRERPGAGQLVAPGIAYLELPLREDDEKSLSIVGERKQLLPEEQPEVARGGQGYTRGGRPSVLPRVAGGSGPDTGPLDVVGGRGK